ncbi:Lrp/AsnC family transcriptional regulator [Eubacteriales bacterium OttesenSCG-928-N13]|nr:Lrp/AsnC family transcriptional regulator [Eubacteriales bacterium OttesenSCG-928-N13]
MITDFELSILEVLMSDARTAHDRIALMVGSTEADVTAAIADMEQRRIIVNYPATINWDLVSRDEVEALIEVRVTPQRGEGFDAIAEQIYRFEEVSSVYLMSGAYDLMVLIRGRTMKQLALFVAEKLSTLENVNSTATHFVLKKYKLNGVILEGGQDDNRLAVSP